MPRLDYHDTFARDGVPGLFDPEGYRLAWTDYQAMLVQRLNEMLAGEPEEYTETKSIVLKFARDPMNASLFNHASMAHNNHFFMDALSTSPQTLDQCPALKEGLENTFGTIDNLRTTMLDTASAMFGPGFVWLVWVRPPADAAATGAGGYRILTTYIAGTPYPEAGYRQQGLDMASNTAATFGAYAAQQQRPANTVGSFGPHSLPGKEAAKYPPGGTEVTPVLCVNTWEHVYLYNFGLTGKRKYLSDWWDCVDWHHVETNAPNTGKPVRTERAYNPPGR